MPDPSAAPPDFDALLHREVEHVLEDPAFLRSPTQSRLLRYLREETIRGHLRVSQFSVAVDGLGREDDYDLGSDSYPRVQVSRLRHSLAGVYSRIEPRDGLCVFIRKGEYRLYLAPRATAYPEQRARRSDFRPPEADAVDGPETKLGPAPPADHAPLRSGDTQPLLFQPRTLLVIALVTSIIAAIALGRDLLASHEGPAIQQEPLIHFALRTEPGQPGGTPSSDIGNAVRQKVIGQIGASLIAGLSPPDLPASDAPYDLELGFHGRKGTPQMLELVLTDPRDTTLYRATIPFNGSERDFLGNLGNALDDILAPYGIIAQHELDMSSGKPQTDYGCFVAIEVMRNRSQGAALSIDECLDRFPGSEYKPYWLARKSFDKFQAGIARGIPLERNRMARAFYHEAFTLDPNNAFVNALAAKLAVSKADCAGAAIFSHRAIANGQGFPKLRLLIGADLTSCPQTAPQRAAFVGQLRSIALRSNELKGQLALLINLAALGTENDDLIALVQRRTARVDVEGPGSPVIKAIEYPAYRAAHGGEIRRAVEVLVWNPASRVRIMQGLDAR